MWLLTELQVQVAELRKTFTSFRQEILLRLVCLITWAELSNPFNQNTRINYSIPTAGVVELILYDMQGRPAKIMVNGTKVSW
jgi:hypothetical protein